MATPIEGGDVQGTEPNSAGSGDGSSGQNPAWGEALSAIPEQYHSVLTPHFQQWDQSAQQRIEQVNSQLKEFEAYKPLVENGIGYSDVEQGLQLMYQINTNPQGVYEALAQAYGFNANPNGTVGQEAEEEEDEGFQDPRFDEFAQQQQQLRQGLDLVAQTLLQQEQAKMDAAADAQIEQEINQLKEKFPGISEEYALSLMINGFDVDQIGERWTAMTQSVLQQNPRPFAPNVMGNSGGTGLPSQAIDPRKLDGQGTRNLVIQMLNAANRES